MQFLFEKKTSQTYIEKKDIKTDWPIKTEIQKKYMIYKNVQKKGMKIVINICH